MKPPRVAASPVHLECLYHASMVLPGRTAENTAYVVVGRVIGVHVADDALTADGKLDIARLRPLARLGYHDYTAVDSVFTMAPGGPNAAHFARGLAGVPKNEAAG